MEARQEDRSGRQYRETGQGGKRGRQVRKARQ